MYVVVFLPLVLEEEEVWGCEVYANFGCWVRNLWRRIWIVGNRNG
jgi:hypothetical protein